MSFLMKVDTIYIHHPPPSLSLTLCMILHPAVDVLSYSRGYTEVHSFHISPKVLLNQMHKLWVKGDAFLQEEAVGKSDHVVDIIIRQSSCQVL